MKRRLIWPLVVVVTTAAAQQPQSVHLHNTPNADIIDGSKTPNLIPDSTAYRLWLLSVTAPDPKHPELNQQRQDAFLRTAGFEDEDLPTIRQVLFDFRTAYDAMVKDHNDAEAAGFSPSLVSLKSRRDTLVNQTQASLLSVRPRTREKVSNFIQGEKRHMRASKTEVQP